MTQPYQELQNGQLCSPKMRERAIRLVIDHRES